MTTRANYFTAGDQVEETRVSLGGFRSLHRGIVKWLHEDEYRASWDRVGVVFEDNRLGAMALVHPSRLRKL